VPFSRSASNRYDIAEVDALSFVVREGVCLKWVESRPGVSADRSRLECLLPDPEAAVRHRLLSDG
jgi:hypothetical protein